MIREPFKKKTVTVRNLPQNLTAEQAAVSILSKVEECLTAYAWDERMFLDPTCKRMFNHIVESRSKGDATDEIALTAKLEGEGKLLEVGDRYGVQQLLETCHFFPGDDANVIELFHRELVDAAARRAVLIAAAENEEDLRSGQISAEDYISTISDAAATTESRKQLRLGDQMEQLLQEIENRTPVESFGFGLQSTDRDLDGGCQRGELLTVAGPTGGGKSLMLAMGTLDALKANKAVLFFSLEMPAKAVLRRLVANHANVALPKPRERIMTETMAAITPAIHALQRMNLTIIDSLHMLAEIEAETRRLVKLGKADLLVVDYVQRVRHTKADNREQTVAEITSRLKSLALTANIAVMTASQLNKQGDVRESSAIEQDSDTLLKITEEGILCTKFRRGATNWLTSVEMRGELGRFNETYESYVPATQGRGSEARQGYSNKKNQR